MYLTISTALMANGRLESIEILKHLYRKKYCFWRPSGWCWNCRRLYLTYQVPLQVTPADAIVYRNDFLTGGLNARSLSHEIGHWFGLSHTFGGY
jgi:hypothetical protein